MIFFCFFVCFILSQEYFDFTSFFSKFSEVDDDEEDDTIANDAMIKAKKPTVKKATAAAPRTRSFSIS